MTIDINNAKNYHFYLQNDVYLSLSDDEVLTNSFKKSPNTFFELLNYPKDNTLPYNFSFIRMKKSVRTQSPEKFSRRSSRSPTNPAVKTFSGRKNVKGIKHLTVLIPEDGLPIKKQSEQQIKNVKPFSERIFEILKKNDGDNKKRRIRSQSFDEYLCHSERFVNFPRFFFGLKKLKEKVM